MNYFLKIIRPLLLCILIALSACTDSCTSGLHQFFPIDDPQEQEQQPETEEFQEPQEQSTPPVPIFGDVQLNLITYQNRNNRIKNLQLDQEDIEINEVVIATEQYDFQGEPQTQSGSDLKGPYVSNLIADGNIINQTTPMIETIRLPAGIYEKIVFNVASLADQNNSLVIEGVFSELLTNDLNQNNSQDRIPFRIEIEQNFSVEVVSPQGFPINANQNYIFIAFDIESWFSGLTSLLQNLENPVFTNDVLVFNNATNDGAMIDLFLNNVAHSFQLAAISEPSFTPLSLDPTSTSTATFEPYCGDLITQAVLEEVCDEDSLFCSDTCQPVIRHLSTDFGMNLKDNEDVFTLQISPDSTWVAFIEDWQVDAAYHVYTSTLDGSKRTDPIHLTRTLGVGQYNAIEIINNEQILINWTSGLGVTQVYLATWNDRNSLRLLKEEAIVKVTSDGRYALYREVGSSSLFRLDLNDENPAAVLVAEKISSFALASATNEVVYIANNVNDNLQLFKRKIDGSNEPVLLSHDTNNADLNVTSFKVNKAGDAVVFSGDLLVDGELRLFSNNLNGDNLTLLSASLIVEDNQYQIAENSNRVVFIGNIVQGNQDVVFLGSRHLYETRLHQELPRLISATDGLTSPTILSYTISSDGRHIVFYGTTNANQKQLYVSSPDNNVAIQNGLGGRVQPTSLYTPDNANHEIRNYQISADSSKVIVVGDIVTDEEFKLYSVSLTSSQTPELISQSLTHITQAALADDNQTVVFVASDDDENQADLYSTRVY